MNKTKNKIRYAALFLICALMFALVSCAAGSDKNVQRTGGGNASKSEADEVESVKIERPNIPEGTNYGGAEFRALVPDAAVTRIGDEIYAEEESGDVLNDAVYTRNRLVEDMLNIKITTVMGQGHWLADLPKQVRNVVQAGDDVYDIMDGVYQPPLAFEGLLINLYKVPNMDLSKPWWDQRMIEDLSYRKSQLYYIIGDIGYFGMSGVMCTLFNKQLFSDNGFDFPYDKVREGAWTLDEYSKLIRAAALDLNGDGKMDETDQWGSYGNSGTVLWSMLGCGENVVALDQDGVPFINSLSDRHVQVVTALGTLTSDKNVFLLAENIKSSSDPYDLLGIATKNGHFLFFSSTLAQIQGQRALEYDFGVIPYPKFDENQPEYRSPATSYSSGASSISIPVTNSNTERTGMILEALSGYSTDIIIPALIDVALKSKYTRDEDSAEMVEIILRTKFFDRLMEYGWGSISWGGLYWNVYSQLTLKGADTFVSAVEKQMSKADADTEKFISTFDELN